MNPERLGQGSLFDASPVGLGSGVNHVARPKGETSQDLAGIQEIHLKTRVMTNGEQQDNDMQNLEKEMDEMTDPGLLRDARRDQECKLPVRNSSDKGSD